MKNAEEKPPLDKSIFRPIPWEAGERYEGSSRANGAREFPGRWEVLEDRDARQHSILAASEVSKGIDRESPASPKESPLPNKEDMRERQFLETDLGDDQEGISVRLLPHLSQIEFSQRPKKDKSL